MYKRLLAIILFSISLSVKAQTAEDVFSKYVDFNDLAIQGQTERAIKLGEEIAENADKLPEKTKAKFEFLLASLYDSNKQYDQALTCYDKVIAVIPNYFVAQRAAGYLHVKKLNQIGAQLNAAKTNINENKRLTALCNAEVKKTLPYLEKAQACDPTGDTLALIKMLYKNIKDEQGLKSLDSRLAGLSKDCVDLITD